MFNFIVTEPYSLQTVPYVVKYDPPPPHEPGTRRTPEEIEEELLQQEKELDELILLEITFVFVYIFMDLEVINGCLCL